MSGRLGAVAGLCFRYCKSDTSFPKTKILIKNVEYNPQFLNFLSDFY